jgi:hypothetical protein
MTDAVEEKLEGLFRETGRAHHQAFLATDGVDPEWPIWYAGFLQDRVNVLSSRVLTKSELVYLIIAAEKEREAIAPEAQWPRYYARYIAAQLT